MAARGIRNNNPGNIRRSGQKFAGEIESKDKNFKQFSSMAYGYRAMFRVITTYIKHRNVHRLDQIITRWAPSQDDNDTATYINFVCGVTKFKPDRIIDCCNENDMRMLVSAMSQMENGVKAVKADVQAGWNLFYFWKMKNLKLISLISIPLAPIMELVEKYVFGDWEFAKFLIVLVVIDTMLGFAKHYMLHDISSKAYGMIAKKLIVYSVVMIVGHVLASFAVNGQSVESFVWFRYFSCSALLVREGISILENSNTIYPGLIPKAIIRRLADFDSHTGSLSTRKEGMMIAAVDLLIFLLIMMVVACIGAICLFGYILLQQCIIDEAEEDSEDFVKIDEDEGKV